MEVDTNVDGENEESDAKGSEPPLQGDPPDHETEHQAPDLQQQQQHGQQIQQMQQLQPHIQQTSTQCITGGSKQDPPVGA